MIERLVNDREVYVKFIGIYMASEIQLFPYGPLISWPLQFFLFNNKNVIDKDYVQKNFMFFFTSDESYFQKISMTTILMISKCGFNIPIMKYLFHIFYFK